MAAKASSLIYHLKCSGIERRLGRLLEYRADPRIDSAEAHPRQETKYLTPRDDVMKLSLDCEFTQLNQSTKLISLALVAETGEELYVELPDTCQVKDCSDFVIENVLPQFDLASHGLSLMEAQNSLRAFLAGLEPPLVVCSDVPSWDWGFFCQLACVKNEWPS